jgi:lipid-binding SYLF domain-containing protein
MVELFCSEFGEAERRKGVMKRRSDTMNVHARLRTLVAMLSITVTFFIANPVANALTKAEIDVGVTATLSRFQKDIKGGSEYLNAAKGVLVMPHITKAGFIVGGQYGQGSLQVGDKTVQYYNLISGSLGYQIGAEQYDMVIIFMTDDALNKFRKSDGWEAGVDAEVTLVQVGANLTVETLRSQHPIAGFVFDQKGLMAGVSIKGAKFSPIHTE